MLWFLGIIGLAYADCEIERTDVWTGERFVVEIEGRVERGPVPCRRIVLGTANDFEPDSVLATVRAWDDTRTVFRDERIGLLDGEWVLSLPELRDEHRFSIRIEGMRGAAWPRATADVQTMRTRLQWLAHSKPLFGPKGNVGLEVSQTVKVSGAGSVAHVWFPAETGQHHCEGEGTVRMGRRGCLLGVDEEGGGTFEVRWARPWASSSMEWTLGPEEELHLSGVEVESSGLKRLSADAVIRFAGPGRVSARVTSLGGVAVPDTALVDVDYGARARSMPEPSVGLEFKGAEVSVNDLEIVLERVRDQVVLGSLPGAHPLKPRSLMDARSSGWATPFESALILTRYLEQLGFDAEAIPVRPLSMGRVVGGAPIGFTGAVVLASKGGTRVWLDPSCRACGVGEVEPSLWGGMMFHGRLDTMPDAPGTLFLQEMVDGVLGVRLEGVAAVRLRQAIVAMPTGASRSPAIAEIFAGEGARLLSIDGVSKLGHPVVLRIEPQSLK